MNGWKNRAVTASPWLQETSLRKTTIRWFIIQVVGGLIATILLFRLVFMAQVVPAVTVKTVDGGYVTLVPGTQALAAPISEAELLDYCETIVETALTRNETVVPGDTLKPYTTTGFINELGVNFVENLDSGYFQTYRVERSRIHRGSRNFLLLRMQGTLISGTLDFYTNNTLTLEVAFRRFKEPRVGEAQWKAHGIVPIPSIEYDPDAVQEAIREKTNIEN